MNRENQVLIACEESQAVCMAFRAMGIEAFSNDVLDCSGGHSEFHLKCKVEEIINEGWAMMIAFPPCTHLSNSGAAWFEQKRKDGRQQQGIDLFLSLWNAPIKRIAIENPVGIMSSVLHPPTQKIQPYYFGDKHQKTTCLWLKNLPLLYHNDRPNLFDDVVTHTDKGEFFEWVEAKTGRKNRQPLWYYEASFLPSATGERGNIRSKTFPGIASAMAKQWGELLKP